MADFLARQRVQIHDGTDEYAVTSGKPIYVAISDGTDVADVVTINSAFGATPNALILAGKYEATPTTYDDGDAVPLLVDEQGKLQVDVVATLDSNTEYADDSAFTVATDYVGAIGAMADETAPDSVDEGDIGIPRMTLDRKLLVRIVGATDANRLDIDANGSAKVINQANSGVDIGDVTINNAAGASAVNIQDGGNSITVDAIQLDIDDLNHATDSVSIGDGTEVWSIDASGYGQVDIAAQSVGSIAVSKDNNANTETNPIYVQEVSGTVSGIEIHDFNEAVDVAKVAAGVPGSDLTSIVYVAAGGVFLCKSVILAASGSFKAVIKAGADGSEATKNVVFGTASSPTVQVFFDPPIEVANTDQLMVDVYNTDNDDQSIYGTIIGNQL